MTLYIDIGNTNIKMNFNNKYVSFSTKENYTVDSLYKELPEEIKGDVVKVLISSVVPSKQALVEGMSKKYWNVTPLVIAYPLKTGIKINVDDPKSIGSDLVCLAAYASSISDATIVVNMGTATTITYTVNKTLQGVIIFPGFITSLDSLVKNAAKLSEVNLYLPNKPLGRSSVESISIGMIMGHVHAIRGFVNDIDKDAKLILSGGNSKAISKYLPEFEFVKEATIEGMKVIKKVN